MVRACILNKCRLFACSISDSPGWTLIAATCPELHICWKVKKTSGRSSACRCIHRGNACDRPDRREEVAREKIWWLKKSAARVAKSKGAHRANSALLFAAAACNFAALGSGRSVAWLARLFRVQEVVSSNLTAPTIFSTSFLVSNPVARHCHVCGFPLDAHPPTFPFPGDDSRGSGPEKRVQHEIPRCRG